MIGRDSVSHEAPRPGAAIVTAVLGQRIACLLAGQAGLGRMGGERGGARGRAATHSSAAPAGSGTAKRAAPRWHDARLLKDSGYERAS